MPTFGGTYSTGTITVGAAATSVTGNGVLWADVLEGDYLLPVGFAPIPIAADVVFPFTSLTLMKASPWGALTAAPYIIIKSSWKRYEPALTQAKIRELLDNLAAQGQWLFVEGDEPDPEMGVDGQFAVKVDDLSFRVWLKVSGVWVSQGRLGINPRGPYDSTVEYVTNDAVSRLGSAYIALQNTAQSATLAAITIASPGVVAWAGHGLPANTAVRFTTTGALPTGLVAGTLYFVKTVQDVNHFTVSATVGGAEINTSGSQSGTHTGKAMGLHPPETSPTFWSLLLRNGDVYDVGGFSPGIPASGEKIISYLFPRAITFPAGLVGSAAKAATVATAQAVFSIQKNGVQFGTITVAASATTGAFVAASDTVFAAGDVLDVVGPTPRDTTLADMHVTLSGFR